jgi:hypothetical protein
VGPSCSSPDSAARAWSRARGHEPRAGCTRQRDKTAASMQDIGLHHAQRVCQTPGPVRRTSPCLVSTKTCQL